MALTARLVSVAFLLGVVAPSLASCSAPVGAEDGAPSASTDQPLSVGAGQSACAPTTYFAIVPTAAGSAPACDAVPGRRGTWQYAGGTALRTCFSNADSSDTSVFCSYAWSSSTGAAPDVAALSALPAVSIAPAEGGGATCGDVSFLPYVSLLDDVGVTCPPVPGGPGPNGPKGCDVCGIHLRGAVFGNLLYLPASTTEHTVGLSLSNGTKQIVTFGALSSRGSFAEVALPAPPRGVDYEYGPVLGYAYDSPAP
jgi:hypothetical protein